MKGLIAGYLEHIASSVFDRFHSEITVLIGKEHGVYALYKKNRLYYVGLATNLKSRVKQHLKDKHAKKWDSFSLYLIHKTEHLREVEALVTHIAEPKGNIQRGKFARSTNLLRMLKDLMEEKSKIDIERILGGGKRKGSVKIKAKKQAPRDPILHRLLSAGTQLRATYKGKETFATIEPDGRINLNGTLFQTPSGAGLAVIERGAINGWRFWHFKNTKGTWTAIGELLKGKK